jgi:hypothetical protein
VIVVGVPSMRILVGNFLAGLAAVTAWHLVTGRRAALAALRASVR